MDTIEEYKIIESRDLDKLAEKVNAAPKEGWQTYGAPVIHCHGQPPLVAVCCQAMASLRPR